MAIDSKNEIRVIFSVNSSDIISEPRWVHRLCSITIGDGTRNWGILKKLTQPCHSKITTTATTVG